MPKALLKTGRITWGELVKRKQQQNGGDSEMKNLKKIREKQGMSIEELAVSSHQPYGTVRTWDSNTKKASAEGAWEVAKVLGVTVEDLLK